MRAIPHSLVASRVAAGLLGILMSSHALAHFPWVESRPSVEPKERNPTGSSPLLVRFVVGHGLADSGARTMDPDRLAETFLISPRSARIPLNAEGDRFVSEPLTVEGPYLVVAVQHRNYYTRTAQGANRAPRTETPGALHCSFSENTIKGILGTGDGENLRRILGHQLELIPLDAPAMHSPMRVKVRYRGEPYATPLKVYNTAGVEYEIISGMNGIATIPVESGGWLILANVRSDYADPHVCDVESLTATLSFQVGSDD